MNNAATAVQINTPVPVTRDEELAGLCRRWKELPFIALDTEFIRVNTFYPRLGLIQVCDGEASYLLDPLALDDWQGFVEILRSLSVVKVLHSCSEDLQVFSEFFDCIPGPLFDTQRAAAFLGFGYSISYQNLVMELTGREIPKGETRSDWLRRPLSRQQMEYAALDVAFLPEIHEVLQERLQQRDRLQPMQEDCEQLREIALLSEDRRRWERLYLSVHAAWRLSGESLTLLQALCVWRESEARRLNKPRSWVARDNDLILLAEHPPRDEKDLRSIGDLSAGLRHGDQASLLGMLQNVRERSREQTPPEPPEPIKAPLTPGQRRRIKKCQSVVREISEQMGVAQELLARKKQLIALLQARESPGPFQWPEDLEGWRRDVLEAELLPLLDDE